MGTGGAMARWLTKAGPGDKNAPKKKKMTSAAWQEAKALILARRGRLGIGLALMLVNRLSGLVLPAHLQVPD